MTMINLTKRQYKICEAVALGLSHYYMDNQYDRREITKREFQSAKKLISTLQKGWMQHADKLPWSCMNRRRSRNNHEPK